MKKRSVRTFGQYIYDIKLSVYYRITENIASRSVNRNEQNTELGIILHNKYLA